MSTPANPLLGSWAGASGVNPPPTANPFPTPLPAPGSATNPWGNPSQLANPASNIKDAWRNQAFTQTQQNQMRNQLIPQFAQMMESAGGTAGDFFSKLTNLGSPFYQQKQRQTAEQGAQQEQSEGAKAREEIQAEGAGYTPSGVGAAAIGGEASANAGNQAELFLNNLFQNEQLQLAGASGLAQLAGLFNPSGLFGGAQGQSTQGPSFADQFKSVMSGLFGGGPAASGTAGPVAIGGG